ncbi:hypothetical protein BV494_24425 (plasmid) [Rahnella sikkimica]|uniref:Uncharacterized protein n=1 Tax=Rahnella sikkimica TaxID=1805933 RepID=A0A2L1UYM6_9GAMM|nr:hypothetical protein BV494_24425 [Rahnella sikkimica]
MRIVVATKDLTLAGRSFEGFPLLIGSDRWPVQPAQSFDPDLEYDPFIISKMGQGHRVSHYLPHLVSIIRTRICYFSLKLSAIFRGATPANPGLQEYQ